MSENILLSNNLKVELETNTLSKLFEKPLSIPDYQRPYEWNSYHVKNLLNDTYNSFKKAKTYLIGTIILNEVEKKEEGNNKQQSVITYEIIDGQQRLLTLAILMKSLKSEDHNSLLNCEFKSVKSIYYIKNTKREIDSFKNTINKDAEKYLEYLEKKLNFSILKISGENALDQAYTFFDSLNSKGKGLSDFDLLKAHHLMFIPEEQENLARKHNDYWQSKDEKHQLLFSSVLRRIRMWSRGKDRDDNAERNNFYEFISTIEPNELEKNEHLFNRYMQPNVFRSWHRENDEVTLNMKYEQRDLEALLPFEIPQTIEGGDSFFLYAKRYHEMFDLLFFNTDDKKRSTAIKYVKDLSDAIKNDYLSTSFKAVMLLYYDKFGEQRIIEVATCAELIISKIRFNWGNTRPSPIRIETTLSWVKNNNLIPIVLNSTISSHVLNLMIHNLFNEERKHKESNTLKEYLSSIQEFYRNNKSKINNLDLVEKINSIYPIKKENNE